MKLLSISAVLFITTLGLAGLVNGICVVRHAIWPAFFWYQCSISSDYLADVQRAPLGLERVSFAVSNIPLIRNNSFARLGAIKVLVVVQSAVKDIEDDAFKGLTDLLYLDLSKNELETVKAVWFQQIPKIEYIDLRNNRIKDVQQATFGMFPNKFRALRLENNRLTCLPVSGMSTFQVRAFQLAGNPLTWRCIMELSNWSRANRIAYLDMGGLEATENVTKSCIAQSSAPDPDDQILNTCVETSLAQLLPKEEYTLQNLCNFLSTKPNSYFNCTSKAFHRMMKTKALIDEETLYA